jgi:hypothetical protein
MNEETMYRYKITYESGREFVVLSDEPPGVFVFRECKGESKVKFVYQTHDVTGNNDQWFQIHPRDRY